MFPKAELDRLVQPPGVVKSDGEIVAAGQGVRVVKWFLWHGNVFRSLQTVDDITTDLEDEDTGGQQDKDRHDKLAKAVREFGGYLAANASAIPNYGERYR